MRWRLMDGLCEDREHLPVVEMPPSRTEVDDSFNLQLLLLPPPPSGEETEGLFGADPKHRFDRFLHRFNRVKGSNQISKSLLFVFCFQRT